MVVKLVNLTGEPLHISMRTREDQTVRRAVRHIPPTSLPRWKHGEITIGRLEESLGTASLSSGLCLPTSSMRFFIPAREIPPLSQGIVYIVPHLAAEILREYFPRRRDIFFPGEHNDEGHLVALGEVPCPRLNGGRPRERRYAHCRTKCFSRGWPRVFSSHGNENEVCTEEPEMVEDPVAEARWQQALEECDSDGEPLED